MTRKGYQAELECKKELQKEFGVSNVIKVAIGSFGSDFIAVSKGRLVKCVEVKECHAKKYYPTPDEKKQFKRIIDFCDEHDIHCEIWIKHPGHEWIKDLVNNYI
jgi:Holliday junction resolvase